MVKPLGPACKQWEAIHCQERRQSRSGEVSW